MLKFLKNLRGSPSVEDSEVKEVSKDFDSMELRQIWDNKSAREKANSILVSMGIKEPLKTTNLEMGMRAVFGSDMAHIPQVQSYIMDLGIKTSCHSIFTDASWHNERNKRDIDLWHAHAIAKRLSIVSLDEYHDYNVAVDGHNLLDDHPTLGVKGSMINPTMEELKNFILIEASLKELQDIAGVSPIDNKLVERRKKVMPM